VRIPDGTKVRLREDGREGIIDGLMELVALPGRNPDSRTQYRINIGDLDRTLAIEDELLVLTDAEGVVLMGNGKMNIAVWPLNSFRRYLALTVL